MTLAQAKYDARAGKANSLVCVGLDSETGKLPERFKKEKFPQFEFNKWIIDQTAEYAAAFKPNVAAYEPGGAQGWLELEMTMDYISKSFPDIFTICDAKRADIGYTSELYAQAVFDTLGFDAITLHPYLGRDGVQPFLDRKDKISIILCRTSNPGAAEFQDLEVGGLSAESGHAAQAGKKLWEIVAEKVVTDWNVNQNCMLVVGATYPEELKSIRAIAGDMTLLVPGIGTQGGSVEAVMKAGLNSYKKGLIVSSSKAIIFSNDPAAEAKKLRDEINLFR